MSEVAPEARLWNLMRGGISERLIAFASSLVGHIRGGLGQVNVLASLFFGGVSGSAIADVSAIGGTMILGLDRAYARARQIARPEEWLNAAT